MEKLVVSNDILFAEVVELLKKGKRVTIPVKGGSMLPFIVSERDTVTLERAQSYSPGDIVLFQYQDRYILHRIIRIDADGIAHIQGDGVLNNWETADMDHIFGRVIEIQKHGKRRIDPSRQPWKAWRRLGSQRRWPLAIMRRLCLLACVVLCIGCVNSSPKIVGITSGIKDGRYSIRTAFISAVEEAGNIPVILPMVETEDEAERIYSEARIDCLFLSGGEDVDPKLYGENPIPECEYWSDSRDLSEMCYAKVAIRRKMPVLAICRGCQILNVILGGTLYQDIPAQLGYTDHLQKEGRGVPTQNINITEGSILHSISHSDSIRVNSFHHQAVKKLAPGLIQTATADDGVIEGYEGPGILAVQFHPEELVMAGDRRFIGIFTFDW